MLELCSAAEQLLNITSRGVSGRPLYQFFSDHREHIGRVSEIASRGHVETLEATLRPRERAPLPVALRVEADVAGSVLWTIGVLAQAES